MKPLCDLCVRTGSLHTDMKLCETLAQMELSYRIPIVVPPDIEGLITRLGGTSPTNAMARPHICLNLSRSPVPATQHFPCTSRRPIQSVMYFGAVPNALVKNLAVYPLRKSQAGWPCPKSTTSFML